ncbi:MAG: hypothetical protein ACHQHN_11810 [Sphingobacteriales bacterium]
MKKSYLLAIAIVFAVRISYAQWTTSGSNVYYNSGNVGIGTTNPKGILQIIAPGYDLLTSPYTVDIGLNGTTGGWARAFRVVNTSGSNGQDGGAFGVMGAGTTPYYVYLSIPTTDITGYNSSKILALNNSGNVGIGTTNPLAAFVVNNGELTVNTNGSLNQGGEVFRAHNQTNGNLLVSNPNVAVGGSNLVSINDAGSVIQPLQLRAAPLILTDGNFGIGTTAPGAFEEIYQASGGSNSLRLNTGFSGGNYIDLNPSIAGVNNGGFSISQNGNIRFIIDNSGSGNVGVGTTDTHGYKFAVNGSAVATSMTVKLYANWPDYVFKKDYRLPRLSDVETYIDANHHLPEMPAGEQIAKDGLNLGEMNKVLVKKVEELTLYLIAQNKQLALQHKINRSLQRQINKINNYRK